MSSSKRNKNATSYENYSKKPRRKELRSPHSNSKNYKTSAAQTNSYGNSSKKPRQKPLRTPNSCGKT
jgi:hypothetical protein